MDGDSGVAAAAETLVERMYRNMTGALEPYTVYLGERLGLYRALADSGDAASAELAARTGTTAEPLRYGKHVHSELARFNRHMPGNCPEVITDDGVPGVAVSRPAR
jgi:hypothetical protein